MIASHALCTMSGRRSFNYPNFMKIIHHHSCAVSPSVTIRAFQSWFTKQSGVSTLLNDAGLPMDTGVAATVLENKQGRLDPIQLQLLMSNNATALVVRNFYPKESAIELGEALAKDVQTGKGRNWKVMSASKGLESSDVVTLGSYPPYNVAQSQGKEEEYFAAVPREMNIRRRQKLKVEDDSESGDDRKYKNVALPLWPMDLFRLELDEAWPAGAGIARNPQNPQQIFGFGLPRVMLGPTRWKYGFIHCDEQPPISPHQGIFSANIYLQLPDDNASDKEKGILEIWPLAIRSITDWYKHARELSALSSQDPEEQYQLRKMLGEPHSIRVEPGDLIMLCVQRPHAAIGFKDGVRVSLQCFVQHSGPDNRLLIDS